MVLRRLMSDHLVEIAPGRLTSSAARFRSAGRALGDAAGDDAAAQQPVAGQTLVQAQQPLADAEAVRVGNGEAGVGGDHAEVGHVVVEPLHLQQDHALIAGGRRHGAAGQRLQRLAVGQRVADGRVAGDALGQRHPFLRRAPLEQLLRALVGEVEADLQVDHRFADHAEAEMPRLDDAGMHRADGDLVDALAADRQEGERRAVVRERRRRRRVLAQRMIVGRPESVLAPAAAVRDGRPARCRTGRGFRARSARRADRRSPARAGSAPGRAHPDGVEEPVFGGVGEEVVHLEDAAVGAAVVGGHQGQLGLEVDGAAARPVGARPRRSRAGAARCRGARAGR